MSFHEEVEVLLQLINSSNNEGTKERYFKRLEEILENYVQKRLQAEQDAVVNSAWDSINNE
ncbi:hypothetical protein SPFL3102_03459 [Sporomusaceae bacterium FL31]|nr:hypothetical protein SPFL3101_02697 [Sporomusaceae bacterium FL31]GCE35608.1 hypothetical protein SPFL3102_03459 [Sporomusaceae bacterium]